MKKIKYILASFMVVVLSGCSDFLDLSPISQANENGFYQTEEDFETAMVSVYNTLYTIYGPQSLPSYYGEMASDNAYCDETAGNYTDKISLSQHQNITSANSIVEDFWNTYYESMFKINNVISKLEGKDFDKKTQFEGEARFIRALYYFDLVRAFGDVPLVLKPVSVSEAYAMGRTPTTEVYAAIIEDLQFAAENLPAKSGERFAGAATSDAANALLGKVYLTMGDKTNATTALMKIYGKFSLESNFVDLWDSSNKNCKESIFEVQYIGGKSNPYSLYWSQFTPIENYSVTAWGRGVNQVTDDLYNAFEDGDVRRDASIQNGYTSASGVSVAAKFFVKWRDDDAEIDGLTECADNNFIILRYADVLLMLSEATDDAKYLNEVRHRVNLQGYGEAGYPSKYSTLTSAIQHERQVELCGEFHRMFDLVRLGTAIETLNSSTKATNITSTNQLLLPIPQSVIDQNPDVITQNEAYK